MPFSTHTIHTLCPSTLNCRKRHYVSLTKMTQNTNLKIEGYTNHLMHIRNIIPPKYVYRILYMRGHIVFISLSNGKTIISKHNA